MGLTGLSSLGSLSSLNPLGGSQQQTAPATAPTNTGPAWLTGEMAQIVTILLGLILIGAGLFSFKSSQKVLQVVGHTAAAAA